MFRALIGGVFFLALTMSAWAQEGSRSYVFNGVVTPKDCKLLPQSSFDIAPSLSRSHSAVRLYVKCGPIADGTTLLSLTFLLADTPPPLPRGVSRSYSFRWDGQVGKHLNPMAGEFTHEGSKCLDILALFAKYANAKDPNVGPSWTGGCVAEAHWGMVMELTLTESTR